MFSLRKTIKNVLIATIAYILVVLMFNFVVVPSVKHSVNDFNQDMHELSESILNMDLPVRVINNVQSQVLKDASNLENQNLIDAYNSNTDKLLSLSAGMMEQMDRLETDLEKLNQWTLKLYNGKIQEMVDLILSMRYVSQDLPLLIENQMVNQIDMKEISSIKIDLEKYSESFEDKKVSFNNSILNAFTWLVNIQFVGMVLVLLAMSIGIYKFVTNDQKFILDSFKHLSGKKYDFKELPKFKPFFEEGYQIKKEVKEIFSEELFAQRIKDLLLSTYHIDDLMQQLFKAVSENNAIDRIGIAFVDYSRGKFVAEYGISSYTDVKLGPGFEVDIDKTSLKEVLETKKSFITDDLISDYIKKPNSPSLRLITEEGIQSNLVVPVLMGEVVFGLMFFSSRKRNYFRSSHQRVAEKLIYEISGFLNRAYFTKVILSKITGSFSELVDQKDNETGGHIRRMVAYSTLIAKGLLHKDIEGYEVCEKFILEIERNASSHDIGKVGIPDEILKKPGKLTTDEWVIMKTHTTIGADIFKSLREGLQVFDSDFYKFAEEIARYHHERYDGSGYPEGLSGQDIPLSARIVAIADVFDALNSKRHYKESFGFEKSLDIIKESSGSHLDPVLVDVFFEQIDEVRKISML